MTYDIDTFVNVTAKENGRLIEFEDSVDFDEIDLFERFPEEFEKLITFDTKNTQADPVFVYGLNGEPVAFYDCELLRGYIVDNV